MDGQTLDDDLRLGHALGAVGQVDADDRRQQLRSQPDRQRQGEEEGVEHRPVQVDVDGEDDDHEHQRHLHQEVAEPPHAVLELGLGRPEPEPLGDLAELRCPSRCGRPAACAAAAHHVRAHEERVGPRWPSGVSAGSVPGSSRPG